MAPLQPKESQYFDARRFWRHGLASAVLAQRLALLVAVPPALAFTAGLLQRIGLLALASVDPACFDEVAGEAESRLLPLAEACQALLGWDYDQLGAALAERWDLPSALCDVIAEARQPPAGRHLHGDSALVDVVHVAGRLAHLLVTLRAPAGSEALAAALSASLAEYPLWPATGSRLDLSPAQLCTALSQGFREFERLQALID